MVKSLSGIKEEVFKSLDRTFLRIDKGHLRRTRNLELIPTFERRRGGKVSYAEWAYVIGIFHTLIQQSKPDKNPVIVDVGCGTGLLGIASYNQVISGGKYIGIDIIKSDIQFCEKHFPKGFEFIHLDASNPTYALNNKSQNPWPINDEAANLITALSVWTHFNEKDAKFYFAESSRIMKQNARFIVTLFLLDDHYTGRKVTSSFHNSNSFDWVFDLNAYESEDWKTTHWASVPEDVIGVTEYGFAQLLDSGGLEVESYFPGTWKGYPGLYFQDILILKKK